MKKLKVGIIGAGSIADYHIKAYLKNPAVTLNAICDLDINRAKKTADEFGIKEIYDDYNMMLQNSDTDALSVITWNNTHAPITIAALDSGRHVLCEKPPALNAQEAQSMAKTAERNDRLLMFGMVRRFARTTRVLKEYIDNGELGQIYYAKTGYLRRCGNPGGWFGKKAISGGGPVIDLGVHTIDLCLYLMGGYKPVAVFANTYDRIGQRNDIKGVSWYKAAIQDHEGNDVEDLANALIRLENGASIFFEASWAVNIKKDVFYVDLFGDKGGAKLEPELEIFSEKYNYLTDTRPVLNNYSFDFDQAFTDEAAHFADCIINGSECISPVKDGVAIMKTLDAIYMSASTGKLVEL